jgi:hypothetical protein
MSSERPIREYVALVRRLWGKSIAGPIAAGFAVLLPIIGLVFHSSALAATWLGIAPALVAIILIWPAQYQVWKAERDRGERDIREEREKREAEERRNAKPEIKGELSNFRAHGNSGESTAPSVMAHFRVRM